MAVVAGTAHPGPAARRWPKAALWNEPAAHLAGAAALVGAAAVVSLAWAYPVTRPLARFCCRYTPGRLSHGALWTLPGSALLLPRLHMLGPTTFMAAALFLPYVMVAGTRRALAAFFAGHVVATAAVAAVVLPAAAWGWPPAVVLRNASDVGASAGLAAAAGALAVHLRWRPGGLLLGAALVAWFGAGLVVTQRLVEIEHLLALATGAATDRWGSQPVGGTRRVSLRRLGAGNTLGTGGRAEGHDDEP